jgi:hypothetical protein
VVFFSIFLPRPREAGERLLVLLDGGGDHEGAYTTVIRDRFEQEKLPG